MVSRHPLGPWNDTGIDLNPRPTPGCALRRGSISGVINDGRGARGIPSQNNYVMQVTLRSGEVQYIFTADLWTTAPDGLKSHDLQYWAPLSFDDSKVPPA